MLGIVGGYDSDPEDEKPLTALSGGQSCVEQAAAEATPAPLVPASSSSSASPSALAAGKASSRKLAEILEAVKDAKSATAVVQLVRRFLDTAWDLRWGAEALTCIVKRSTARTRKEWVRDATIIRLAGLVQKELERVTTLTGQSDLVALLLVGVDALRSLGFMNKKEQVPMLTRISQGLASDQWQHPAKTLVRLFFLSVDLGILGAESLPERLRERSDEFDPVDVALVLQALRQKSARDAVLQSKVLARLRAGQYQGLSATDLVEMAEALKDLAADEEAVLRPLGQEVLRRKGELTPDESHRVHNAYSALKLPLPQVWAKTGAQRKRDGSQIVTSQTFVPQEGHEKRRRGNHDVQRPSPPRVVRDYKMMSY